jgi:putative flippase GtrA
LAAATREAFEGLALSVLMAIERFEVFRLSAPLREFRRIRTAVRRRANWIQLVRFLVVGASGYVVNLVIFSLAIGLASMPYQVAAVVAFVVALANNFIWNRHWTFRRQAGRARFQAPRFVFVSISAFALNLLALTVLVSVLGFPPVSSQAVAIACATPVNFAGNKLWSFRR